MATKTKTTKKEVEVVRTNAERAADFTNVGQQILTQSWSIFTLIAGMLSIKVGNVVISPYRSKANPAGVVVKLDGYTNGNGSSIPEIAIETAAWYDRRIWFASLLVGLLKIHWFEGLTSSERPTNINRDTSGFAEYLRLHTGCQVDRTDKGSNGIKVKVSLDPKSVAEQAFLAIPEDIWSKWLPVRESSASPKKDPISYFGCSGVAYWKTASDSEGGPLSAKAERDGLSFSGICKTCLENGLNEEKAQFRVRPWPNFNPVLAKKHRVSS